MRPPLRASSVFLPVMCVLLGASCGRASVTGRVTTAPSPSCDVTRARVELLSAARAEGTAPDADGKYEFALSSNSTEGEVSGSYELRISLSGHQVVSRTVQLASGEQDLGSDTLVPLVDRTGQSCTIIGSSERCPCAGNCREGRHTCEAGVLTACSCGP